VTCSLNCAVWYKQKQRDEVRRTNSHKKKSPLGNLRGDLLNNLPQSLLKEAPLGGIKGNKDLPDTMIGMK
jgi:hypothetical protein